MVRRLQTRALFVDLELTCWEGEPPAGEAREVIEIGIAELDLKSLQITRTFHRLIKPRRSRISSFCEALTGITPKRMKAGRPFDEVARSLTKEFGAAPWMAWGDDKTELDKAAEQHMVSPVLGPQTDFSDMFHHMLGLDKRLSLQESLAVLGLSFEGRPHEALTDAINTARLYAALATRLRLYVRPN